MNKFGWGILVAAACVVSPVVSGASDQRDASPRAGGRTYAQNFKDMVLATCMANAYADVKQAAVDAGSSASALRDWSCYDLEKAPDAIKSLVDQYLARDYRNPLVESEIKGVRFDFLKCMDLYHSQALDALAHRVVIHPGRTYRQDNAPPNKK